MKRNLLIFLWVLVALVWTAFFFREKLARYAGVSVPGQTAASGETGPGQPLSAPPFKAFASGPIDSRGKGVISVTSAEQGFGSLQNNKSVIGGPLVVGGVGYPKGLGTHAYSKIHLEFQQGFKTFSGSCGINDEVGTTPKALFKVINSGKVLFQSPIVPANGKAVPFSIPVDGMQGVDLIVEGKSDGTNPTAGVHADWLDLRLE